MMSKRFFVIILAMAAVVGTALLVGQLRKTQVQAESCIKSRAPGQPTEYTGTCAETASAIYVYLPEKLRPPGTIQVVPVKPGKPAFEVLSDSQGKRCGMYADAIPLDNLSIPKMMIMGTCPGEHSFFGQPTYTQDGVWTVRWKGDFTDTDLVVPLIKRRPSDT